MPAKTFAFLLTGVIAAAGLTVAIFTQTGAGIAGALFVALLAAAVVRLRAP
ncbi:MAG: hypothetical protein ACRCSU_00895 [Paracoccaceae bacterium]